MSFIASLSVFLPSACAETFSAAVSDGTDNFVLSGIAVDLVGERATRVMKHSFVNRREVRGVAEPGMSGHKIEKYERSQLDDLTRTYQHVNRRKPR